MFCDIMVQELRLEPGHVDVGRTLALARLAFQAQVEHLLHRRVGQACQSPGDLRLLLAVPVVPRERAATHWPGRGCCAAHRASPGRTGTCPPVDSCGTHRRRHTAPSPGPGRRPPENRTAVGTSAVDYSAPKRSFPLSGGASTILPGLSTFFGSKARFSSRNAWYSVVRTSSP